MKTKVPFPDADDTGDLFRRLASVYSDTLRQTNDIIARTDLSYLAAPRWLNEADRLSPALTETLNLYTRLAQSVPDALSPALLRYCAYAEQLADSVPASVRRALDAQDRWQAAFQPLIEAAANLAPTEAQLQSLANALRDQADDLEKAEIGDEPPVGREDEEAAAEAVGEVLADPENWEQRLAERLKREKERHPVRAWLIVKLLAFLMSILAMILASGLYETIKAAVLRESPSPGASIVVNIDASRQITVIDEVPYYYKAAYLDAETGKQYVGWISKRSTRKPAPADGDE